MDFQQIFEEFISHSKNLKVLYVATCDKHGKPNSAPKMLVDIEPPNKVYYLDYKFTHTFSNVKDNHHVSLSFMDDRAFKGFRVTGVAEPLESGKEFEQTKKQWEKRVISYEAQRLIERTKGQYSERDAESALPKDFVIIKVNGEEAAVVKPDRVLRALQNQQKPA